MILSSVRITIIKREELQMQELTFDIPYIELDFYAEMLEDAILPENKVSALRGGMGQMLLRQNCVSDRNCGDCMFLKACPVTHTLYTHMENKPVYVTGNESVGYLIECEDKTEDFKKGDRFVFRLILFGDSIVYFNLYLQAFCLLGMSGIGRNRAPFGITEVRNIQGEKIINRNRIDMRKYKICRLRDYVIQRKTELEEKTEKYAMIFTTPLSMKYQKEYMKEFQPEALVKGAARRLQMLNYYVGHPGDLPEFQKYPIIRAQAVQSKKSKRYSSTQKNIMPLRGITGTVLFEEIPDECIDYLIVGELTHIGKNTSFGFGKYFLTSI